MNFRVQLDVFRGPLDLLLYLVRKHEVDILDIPIAMITDQYLEHLAVLEQLDVNEVGDFLEMASMLIEIKSRIVLPRADEEDSELDDPRQELVRRLLEYKMYKDAAGLLEERGRQWQQRFSRLSNDIPSRRPDLSEQPIAEVELWDLVSAFSRVVRENDATQPASIVYDETPIETYIRRVYQLMEEGRPIAISELFQAGMRKSDLIGVFLAVLELVRHQQVTAEQQHAHGEIWVRPSDRYAETLQSLRIDRYDVTPVDEAQEDADSSA